MYDADESSDNNQNQCMRGNKSRAERRKGSHKRAILQYFSLLIVSNLVSRGSL